MKLIPVVAALTLNLSVISHHVSAQTTAPVNPETSITKASQLSLSSIQQENLVLLGQVWGFLKYHHPTIASGTLDWDQELVQFLPQYLAVKNTDARNKLLVQWIVKLGPVAPCTNCKKASEDAVIAPDHQWLYQTEISTTLRSKLHEIYINRHQGPQHYVVTSEVGGPTFLNEQHYKENVLPDPEHRLIALYRYWNIVQYFFPHKDIMENDWNRALGNHLSEIYPGEINHSITDYIEPTGKQYTNPVIVLVNEQSVSQAEYTAMALRATGRATLIGRPTDGSDGDMSIIKLPGNVTTGFSGMGVFYPDGKATQRVGIIPDVNVEQTVAGIKEGQDEVLNAALKYISDKL